MPALKRAASAGIASPGSSAEEHDLVSGQRRARARLATARAAATSAAFCVFSEKSVPQMMGWVVVVFMVEPSLGLSNVGPFGEFA